MIFVSARPSVTRLAMSVIGFLHRSGRTGLSASRPTAASRSRRAIAIRIHLRLKA